jgi:hypothetical protein
MCSNNVDLMCCPKSVLAEAVHNNSNLVSAIQSERSKVPGHPLYAFFLDIKKAFDTVNRDMLLLKLFRQGVQGAWSTLAPGQHNVYMCTLAAVPP